MYQSFFPEKIKQIMLLFSCIILTACQDKSATSQQASKLKLSMGEVQMDSSGWPRTLMTMKGPVTLTKAPERIVSTSATITGTLLAIEAPVIASGGTMPNTAVADDQGFLRQWGKVARERGVKVLYQMEPNAEAVVNEQPDLIVVSATGGDSARKLYDQFSSIAPTILIRYDNQSWENLAQTLGQFIGKEKQANQVLNQYKQHLNEVKNSIQLPPQPTTALVYYSNREGANIWTEKSAQGRFLTELGFQLAPIPESVMGDTSMGKRDDIVIATGELFPDAITGQSALLFSASEDRIGDFLSNRFLKQTPPVLNRSVYAMGEDTFRLDYYSSTHLLNRIQNMFVKPPVE